MTRTETKPVERDKTPAEIESMARALRAAALRDMVLALSRRLQALRRRTPTAGATRAT